MNRNFWKGKRVFITGHSGFKGSWLCMLLLNLGADVTGFSLEAPSSPCLSELIGLEQLMTGVVADIRDYQAVKESLESTRPDIVIHMAAQSLVRRSYQEPKVTYAVNVMGTVNLLDAARTIPSIKVIVNVTSDKCYENREMLWAYRENEPLGGHDPYSSSKACAELVTSAYRNSFFSNSKPGSPPLALASVRAGTVIGGGDWGPDRLVPDVITAFHKNESVKIRNPNAIRPWQHVLDPLSGYLMLAEKLWSAGTEYSQAWNFGPSDQSARPVKWVVEYLSDRWGAGAKWEPDAAEHCHEAHNLKLDSSKSQSRLGWSASMCIEQALDWTITWYKQFYSGEDARAITAHQIQEFAATHLTKAPNH
jgi:CDP-glucose 4,6-dehydratase